MSRLGSRADVVFDAVVADGIVLAAQEGLDGTGIRGSVLEDGNGSYRRLEGLGSPEVGILFVSDGEGTGLSDRMASELRSRMGNGLAVVVDRFEQAFAFYLVDGEGFRIAEALLTERGQTHMAWRLRMSSSVAPSISIRSLTMQSDSIRTGRTSISIGHGADGSFWIQ